MDGPASDGWRWPAEWERHAASWLVWPHNPETWPQRLPHAQAQFAGFVRELSDREPVNLLVRDPDSRWHVANPEKRFPGRLVHRKYQ